MKANAGSDRAVSVINRLTHTGDFNGQPFNLRKWQERDIIRPLFKTRPDGLRQYRTCLLMLPRKNGKALALDTEVPTPSGYLRMGDIQVGDKVFGPDGQPSAVTFATDPMVDHPCFRVTFSDGASIVADAEHQWTVFDIWRERSITLTTEEIAISYRIGKRARHREHRYRIPVSAPLEYVARDYLVDPYALGVWLGDGHTESSFVTTADDQIIEHLEAVGVTAHVVASSLGRSNATTYSLGRAPQRNYQRENTLQAKLRAIGVLGNKHVPAAYLCGSIEQRWALLRGLMDTDGSIAYSGPWRTPRCEFSTTSQRLADDAVALIASLGMKPTALCYRARLKGKDCGPVFRVCFTAYSDQPVFGLDRKTERLAQRPATPARSSTRSIVGVDAVESVPVRCIKVDRPDGLFLVGRTCIATHNTELAAAIAIYGLLFDGVSGGEIYLAAADRDQAGKVFGAMVAMIRNDPELEVQVEIIESQKRIVHRKSGSFCKAISAEAYSKHGFNASMVIYDELHCAPNRELYDVLTTSFGGRLQPLMMSISTAGYDRHSILWEVYAHARKVIETPSLDPTFLPIIYEMPADADWTSEREWKRCNPALGDFRSLEDMRIACQRAKEIPAQENTFRRLFLNEWTEQASRWIPMPAWDACCVVEA